MIEYIIDRNHSIACGGLDKTSRQDFYPFGDK